MFEFHECLIPKLNNTNIHEGYWVKEIQENEKKQKAN